MKRSRKLIEDRRKNIIAILQKTGEIRVPEIAGHLKVSEVTVRRDLQYLEDKKYISRYYGGAKIRTDASSVRKSEIEICRENIARYAASLVEDNDTIFINTSSTALQMLKYITAKNVTVITNNGRAIETPKHHTTKVILTGGELYNVKGTLVGEFAMHNIMSVSAKKAFVGCAGLSIENGMTTEILNEVDINRAMLTRATEAAYVLTDHTKLGKNSSFISCPIDLINEVITDERASADFIAKLKEKGIQSHLVSSSLTSDES
ncbi:MAG: DeoR/GlpR family DNA-binding transcription regulator [Eubacterium sp.]